MQTGVICNTSKLKTNGFGFIKPDTGGADIFFHIHGKGNQNLKTLSEGQSVTYNRGVGSKANRVCAENVVPISSNNFEHLHNRIGGVAILPDVSSSNSISCIPNQSPAGFFELQQVEVQEASAAFWERFFSNAVQLNLLSFAELSRCCAVSRRWRTALINEHLQMLPVLSFNGVNARLGQHGGHARGRGGSRARVGGGFYGPQDGFGSLVPLTARGSGCIRDVKGADVLLALERVSSENLKTVDLSGCQGISAGSMEDILQHIATRCANVKEVDVTGCCEEGVLTALAVRARVVCGVNTAQDLYARLKALQEGGARCPLSNLRSLVAASSRPPHLVFGSDFVPDANALFQSVARGAVFDVALLLTVSFPVGKGVRVYEVEVLNSKGESPLLTACGAGNVELARMLVSAGCKVNAFNRLGDTPLLAACGAGSLELAEMLATLGAKVEAVRKDGAGLLAVAIVSQKAELLNFALARGPKRLQQLDIMSASADFGSLVQALGQEFLDPMKVEAWLRDGGASKRVVAGEVGALIASCALDLSTKKRLEDVRALIFHNWDLLQDPSKWPVKHTFQQLAAQEADTVFGDKYDSFEGSPRVIDLINKKDHPCRCIYFAESAVVSVCYSPDGSKLARAEANEVVVCGALTGFAQTTLCGHIGRVWSVSFAGDGTAVASGSGDSTIRIWDVGTSSCKQTLQGHSGTVWSVTFSGDSKHLASGSSDNTVKFWDLSTGAVLKTLLGHSGAVLSVAIGPDGATLASGSQDTSVRLWDLATGSSLHTLQGHTARVNGVTFSGDCKIIASCSGELGHNDNSIRLWSVESGQQIRILEGHTSDVTSVTFQSNGSTMIASASWDNTVRLWDADTGLCKTTFAGHTYLVRSVAFSADGTVIVSSSDDKTIRLWQVPTASSQQALQGHTNWVSAVTFSSTGATMIASSSWDNTVRMWDATGSCQKTLEGHTNWVRAVAFARDGAAIASGSDDNTIRLWDSATGSCKMTLEGHENYVTSVAFSDDGCLVASGSRDNTVRLWDAATGFCRTLKGHTRAVTHVEFLDGETMISSSDDGTTRVWSVATGALQEQLLRGEKFVFPKGTSREQKVGKYIFSITGDFLLISEGQEVKAFFRAPHTISAVQSAGNRIAAGCQNGEVLHLRADWLVEEEEQAGAGKTPAAF